VTFLFTDIEGSTRRWEADPDGMRVQLAAHDDVLRTAIESNGGWLFKHTGDGVCAAFASGNAAVSAAVDAQRLLRLPVRMGVATGEAEQRGEDYFGPALNRAARVMAVGHGGQILVSNSTAALTSGVELVDLGQHQLRDLSEAEHLFQVAAEGLASEFPRLRTASTNLPVPPTRLIGRDDVVAGLRAALAEARLVTLVAAGGSGKTRVAIEATSEQVEHWADGAWFADLTGVSGDTGVGPAVAAALGLEVRSAEPSREIAEYVRGRDLLLVVDNCEHVIDGVAVLLEAVLAAGGTSKILATSREWLGIDGERVFQLEPLDASDPDSPAIELFVERATAVAPDSDFDEDAIAVIATLCGRLDGLPLAIELAASRISVLTPAMLLEGLDDRFRMLSGGHRRQRGRTLQATIDWSYNLLDDDEQRVFRALGVFVGSFDLSAAAAVCEVSLADATDHVESLLARSLVAKSDGENSRFRLLETIKAYAEDRLADADELEPTRDRHIVHFTKLVEATTPFHITDLRRASNFIGDLPNLVAAFEWLEPAERWEELAPLLAPLSLVERATASVWVPRLQRCIERVDDPHMIDQLRRAEAQAAAYAGDWATVAAASREMSHSPDSRTRAFAHHLRSILTVFVDESRAHQEVDRFLAEFGPDPSGEAHAEALALRCALAASTYDVEAARSYAHDARRAFTGLEMRSVMWVNTYYITAVLAWIDGDIGMAKTALAQADEPFEAALSRDAGARLHAGYVRCLVSLGPLQPRAGQPPVAPEVRDYLTESTSGRVAYAESDALVVLALIALRERDPDRAAELLSGAPFPRSQGSGLLSLHLAELLGIRESLQRRDDVPSFRDHDWWVERPRRVLRAELQRRGWM
jgi:predicted ATPase